MSNKKGTAVSIKPKAVPIACLIIPTRDESTLIHSLRMIDLFLSEVLLDHLPLVQILYTWSIDRFKPVICVAG